MSFSLVPAAFLRVGLLGKADDARAACLRECSEKGILAAALAKFCDAIQSVAH
jgi:hypothetical protein